MCFLSFLTAWVILILHFWAFYVRHDIKRARFHVAELCEVALTSTSLATDNSKHFPIPTKTTSKWNPRAWRKWIKITFQITQPCCLENSVEKVIDLFFSRSFHLEISPSVSSLDINSGVLFSLLYQSFSTSTHCREVQESQEAPKLWKLQSITTHTDKGGDMLSP